MPHAVMQALQTFAARNPLTFYPSLGPLDCQFRVIFIFPRWSIAFEKGE